MEEVIMLKKLAIVALTGALSQVAMASDRMVTYAVTITNAHTFHVLAPSAIIAHKRGFELFKLGMPASDGLAYQAENGTPAVLLDELVGNDMVLNTAVGDFVGPGQTATFMIEAPKHARITVTSMLAGSNDAFIGVKGLRPGAHRPALVLDAGSEYNTEDCAHIPGPPCAPDSGNDRAVDGAEGFVSIHNGIHGGVDLMPKESDWRGPLAIVSVKRMY
jgi:hypothetical protein